MKTDSEALYLKKLSEGDHQAFDALFMIYQPKVRNFIYGFIKDEDEACDMAQEIFLRIWKNRHTLSNVFSFKNYLFRIAKNMVLDYFEHYVVKQKYETKLEKNSPIVDFPEEDMYAKELELLISLTIEQMPEQRRKIFRMSREDGFTNEEISIQLNITKKTVENHLNLALSEIRKMLRNVMTLFL